MPSEISIIAGPYRPTLKQAPLTFAEPFPPKTPAARALSQDPRKTLPQVRLTSNPAPSRDPLWLPQADLLGSGFGDQHFVAEIDNDGRAHLRFGDGELGRRPAPNMTFKAVYRTGNGPVGNVGSEAISHIVFRQKKVSGGILLVRNPIPAAGGTNPEPIAEAKLFAPDAFRQELQRAIIADDYRALVERDFADRVQRAAAVLRWNGGRYEALVAVDEFGKEKPDPSLLAAIQRRLLRYRRIGHDIHVKSARLVPLLIEMNICVDAHYLRGHVKGELLDLFSNRVLADGRKGFFHPDNLSFGDGIYLSRLIATAQAVEGVENVEVTRLERLGEGPNDEIKLGVLPLGPVEIAQVDNDPSLPENGSLTLKVGGGR
jgi:predicted phage baseplate assembly protein